jgi:DNA-binding NarL/FixJ family response regulator
VWDEPEQWLGDAQQGQDGHDRAGLVADDRAQAASGWPSRQPPARAPAVIARGHSNAEIAAELRMRLGAVEAHVSRVLAKLEVGNRVQIAVLVQHATAGCLQ